MKFMKPKIMVAIHLFQHYGWWVTEVGNNVCKNNMLGAESNLNASFNSHVCFVG